MTAREAIEVARPLLESEGVDVDREVLVYLSEGDDNPFGEVRWYAAAESLDTQYHIQMACGNIRRADVLADAMDALEREYA